jgi:hypothetical protein
MRKLMIIAVLALPVAGCGAPGTRPAPPPAPVPSSPAPPVDDATNTGTGDRGLDGFVATVQERMPTVAADRRDEELEAVAEQTCALLASGTDAKTIAAVARTLGTADPKATDRATADRLVKLSITEVCPAQRARAAEFQAPKAPAQPFTAPAARPAT